MSRELENGVLANWAFYLGKMSFRLAIKVTVHVGTDQNIEIEIFAEYKYTLTFSNKIFFQYV